MIEREIKMKILKFLSLGIRQWMGIFSLILMIMGVQGIAFTQIATRLNLEGRIYFYTGMALAIYLLWIFSRSRLIDIFVVEAGITTYTTLVLLYPFIRNGERYRALLLLLYITVFLLGICCYYFACFEEKELAEEMEGGDTII